MRQSKRIVGIAVGIVSLLAIATIGFLIFHKGRPPTYFKCSGYYHSAYNNKNLTSQIRITFSDNNGAAILNGVVKDNEGNVTDLTLSLLFSVKIINQSYVLTSTAINTQQVKHDKSMKDPGYEDLLPEVFIKKGEIAIYTLYPQANKQYLFTRGRMPVFYCGRVD